VFSAAIADNANQEKLSLMATSSAF
jgi:hypothetical protein